MMQAEEEPLDAKGECREWARGQQAAGGSGAQRKRVQPSHRVGGVGGGGSAGRILAEGGGDECIREG